MNAGLSRFVMVSLALHLIVLAMLGNTAPRLPVLPASLSVSLDESAPPPQASPRGIRHGTVRERPRHQAPQRKPAAAPAPSPKDTAPANEAAADPVSLPTPPATATPAAQPAPTEPGATTAPGSGQSPAVAGQALIPGRLSSQLESRLRQAMAPYFVYPLMARRNGWEGQVEVGLRVEADGHLSHLHITRSSGYRLLDNAALATLNGIETVPDAAGWLEGRHFDMVLPIEYRLIGGQS